MPFIAKCTFHYASVNSLLVYFTALEGVCNGLATPKLLTMSKFSIFAVALGVVLESNMPKHRLVWKREDIAPLMREESGGGEF